MKKKSCLVVAVIVIIIGIVLFACALVCVLFTTVFTEADFSSMDTTESKTLQSGGADKVVVIHVEGTIMDVASENDIWGTVYASSQKISEYIDRAMVDSKVKAIILSIDSPGGDVYASDIIYNKIKEAQASGIKVVTQMKGVAASGGYYIAAPSDKIVAADTTLTGSIGVLWQFQSYDGLYEKLGIETRTITNSEGEFKTGEGLFDDDPKGEEDKIIQDIVDETFDKFVLVVSEGRGLKKSEVMKFADGRIMSGKQAKEYKLVDELGDLDTALILAEEEAGISNATVVEYKDHDFWSMFSGYLSSTINPTADLAKNLKITPGPRLMYLYVDSEQ